MEDYTKENVIKALIDISFNSRKRCLVDQRSYLIGILVYKFKLLPSEIAKEINSTRFKVYYNQKLAVQFYNDKVYIQNVYVYAQLYPFDFSTCTADKSNRNINIELVVDTKFHKKLKTTGEILGLKDIRTTIKFLLEKSMKIWEK
jgi:hypothetical protein